MNDILKKASNALDKQKRRQSISISERISNSGKRRISSNVVKTSSNINMDIKSPNVEESRLAAYMPEVDKTTIDRNKAFNILTKFEIDEIKFSKDFKQEVQCFMNSYKKQGKEQRNLRDRLLSKRKMSYKVKKLSSTSYSDVGQILKGLPLVSQPSESERGMSNSYRDKDGKSTERSI